MRRVGALAGLVVLLALAANALAGTAAAGPAEDREADVMRIYYEEWNWVAKQGHCSWDTAETVSNDANQHPGTFYKDRQEDTDEALDTVNRSTSGTVITVIRTAAFLYGPGTHETAENVERLVDWTNCFAIKSFAIPVANSLVWTNVPVACYVRNTSQCGMDHTFHCVTPAGKLPGQVLLWFLGGPAPSTPDAGCFVPPGELNCTRDTLACFPTEWCVPPELVIPKPE